MKLHKPRKNPPFPPAAALLLFAAICAYMGAWIIKGAEQSSGLYELRSISFKESCRLSGIVLRREQALCSRPGKGRKPAEGERLRAGTEISGFCLPASALYFSDTDGCENLSPELLDEITPSALGTLMESGDIKKLISPGRLVYGRSWYYAALADSDISAYCPGSYSLRFEGMDKSCSGELIYKSPEEDGKCALVFSVREEGSDFLKLRRAEAELIFAQYSGFQLPLSAVREDADGNKFVYTLTAGRLKREAVEIIYKSGELCIVLPCRENGLREGEFVSISANKDEGSSIIK